MFEMSPYFPPPRTRVVLKLQHPPPRALLHSNNSFCTFHKCQLQQSTDEGFRPAAQHSPPSMAELGSLQQLQH